VERLRLIFGDPQTGATPSESEEPRKWLIGNERGVDLAIASVGCLNGPNPAPNPAADFPYQKGRPRL
jgi:hypothetical protein